LSSRALDIRLSLVGKHLFAVLLLSWSIEFLLSAVLMLFIIVGGISSLHESMEENFFKSVRESPFNYIL
jgi:uncharacterized membrane protein